MILFLEEGGDALSPLLQTLGRLHPLLVHLPIGLLMTLGLLEAWALLRGRQRERKGQHAFVWFAALGASLAAGAGLLLHEEGGYGEIVETHQWLGLAVAALSLLAALCFTFRWTAGYRFLLFTAVLVLVPTGHFGAEMTHGKGFLTEPARRAMRADEPDEPAATEAEPEAETEAVDAPPAARLVAFDEAVAPILEASCVACHGEAKSKGRLAMHTREALLAGGFDGTPFVPGDPAASLMIQRTTLPLDHEDHMPPEGKPQPSAADLALLQAWIRAGASFTEPFEAPTLEQPAAPAPQAEGEPTDDEQSAAATRDQPVQPALAARAPDGARPPAALLASAAPAARATAAPEPLPRPPAAAPEALAALLDARWSLAPLEPGATLLGLDAQAAADRTDTGLARALEGVAAQLGELNLARTEAAHATLAALAAADELQRLDLTGTPVDAAALAALAGHPRLSRLVLTESAVDDAAVETLLSLPALERLYLVGTHVGAEGLARLAAERPALRLYPRAADAAGPPLTAVLEEEPEPVLAKAAAPAAPEPAQDAGTAVLATNATCPVSGAPVSGEHAVLIDGRAIATCCETCALKLLQSPGDYDLQ